MTRLQNERLPSASTRNLDPPVPERVRRGQRTFRIVRLILIVFFGGAAIVATLASFTMLVRGTAIDNIWKQKEHDFHEMLHHRIPIGLGFAVLAVLLAFTTFGWLRRRRWGWQLSVAILAVNLVIDGVALIMTTSWINAMPVAIEALVLTWIVLPSSRSEFS